LNTLVERTLSKIDFWGLNLNKIEGVTQTVSNYLKLIHAGDLKSIEQALLE
jgi:hypothetical protein